MDKPQSWTFLLSINPMVVRTEDRATKLNQDSPLRFASQEDAQTFGNKMFNEPLSVVKWTIVGSNNAPNFPFKNLNKVGC